MAGRPPPFVVKSWPAPARALTVSVNDPDERCWQYRHSDTTTAPPEHYRSKSGRLTLRGGLTRPAVTGKAVPTATTQRTRPWNSPTNPS
jgi:hypothetical protein